MKLPNMTNSTLLTANALSRFENYLREHGCEILPASNEYEVLRFRSALGVGVIYTGKKGLSCNVPSVADAVQRFLAGQQWQAGKVKAAANAGTPKRKARLLARDGDRCWFCGLPLEDDITEEHLVARAQRGHNSLDNIVLTHFKCNERLGHLALVDKIKLRDQMRNIK